MLDQLEALIQQHRLIPDGARLLLGVSGGLDSMVLLHALAQLAPEHNWHLEIAHLNHQLRGRSSDADQRLVAKTATKLRLPCHIAQADVRALAKKQKLSLEMAARHARHEFFAKIAGKRKIRTLALAHHADDQLEHFFLRLLRGAGPEGLAGMQLTRPFPSHKSQVTSHKSGRPLTSDLRPLRIIRPLLHSSKQDLRTFAAAHKIPFREDATNQSLDIQRNRIRHELLPLLRQHYQPALHKIISRLMDILRAENSYLDHLAAAWLQQQGRRPKPKGQKLHHVTRGKPSAFGLGPFSELSPALQRRALQMQLYSAGIQPDFALVEHLRLSPEVPITVAPRTTFHRDQTGKLHQTQHHPSSPDAAGHPAARIQIHHVTRGKPRRTWQALHAPRSTLHFSGLRLSWRVSSAGKTARQTSPIPRRRDQSRRVGIEHLDADTIGPTLTLRHWQPGDRFQPIGMPAPVKLQNLFTNAKIPRAQRHRLLLALDSQGRIFWVQGLRISEPHKMTPATRNILRWTWKPLPNNPERR